MMKRTQHILLTLIILTTLFGCNNIGNTDNPMFGKIYRNATELPEFKGYQEMGGSVIESTRNAEGHYELGFSYLQKKDSHIVILEEIVQSDKKGEVMYKILDTIHVQHVKEDQFLTFVACSHDENFNEKLIVLVSVINDTVSDYKVVKAWLADTKTGRIKALADTKGINCIRNDDEACGVDEYDEVVADSLVSDTTSQVISIDTVITQPIDSVAVKQ
jgi:hypothetical protein